MKKKFILLAMMLLTLIGGVNLNVLNAQTVEIGEEQNPSASYQYFLPVYEYKPYSISQQLYLESDFEDKTGNITSVSFKLGNNRNEMTRQWEVYLQPINSSSFASKTFEPLITATKVYDGNVLMSGIKDDWVTINFTTSFPYSGGNVLLTVYDKSGSALSSQYHTFYAYATSDRTIYKSSDTALDVSSLPEGTKYGKSNQVRFTVEATTPSVKVTPENIALGMVKVGGDYWTEKPFEPQAVNVKAQGGAVISSVTTTNSFFTFSEQYPGGDNFDFTVGYNKNGTAGTQTGNIVVAYDETTKEVPMTATAYVPANGDVKEKVITADLTSGSYSHTASGMYDDYILPGEENDGNNGDAVYKFTLENDAVLTASVNGTNPIVAIYNSDFGEKDGPSSDNNYEGVSNEPAAPSAPTTFLYDFETGDFTGLTLWDRDGDGNNWEIIQGGYTGGAYYARSRSYLEYSPYTNYTPENYIITDKKYYITEKSELHVWAASHNATWADSYKVEVSEDGNNFEVVATIKASETSLTEYITDLSAYVGKELFIAINHYSDGQYNIKVDNLQLTDGSAKSRSVAQTRSTKQIDCVLYPAGTYYLVAAADGDFTLNLSTETLSAPAAATLTAPANEATEQNNPLLTWTLDKFAEEYQLLLGTTNPPTDVVVDWSAPATSYQTEGLANNTVYYWQVKSRNSVDESSSEVFSFVTPLNKPTNVTASKTNLYPGDETTISWEEAAGATSYNVYVGENKVASEVTSPYTLSSLVYNLEYNVNPGHNVTVTANHTLGESAKSDAVVVKMTAKSTVTLTVKNAAENPVEDATVRIYNGQDQYGVAIPEVTFTTNANGQVVEDLLYLNTYNSYYLEVSKTPYITNNSGEMNYYYVNADTYEYSVTLQLSDPTGLTVEDQEIYPGESVILNWETVDEAIGYNVYERGTYSYETYTYEYTQLNTETVAETTFTISNPEYDMNGSYYVVSAIYEEGESQKYNVSDAVFVTGYGSVNCTVNVPGATVVITGIDEFGAAQTYNAKADENGAFSISEILAGSYTAKASALDYQETEINFIVTYDTETSLAVTMAQNPMADASLLTEVSVIEVEGDAQVTWAGAFNNTQMYDIYRMNVDTEEVVNIAKNQNGTYQKYKSYTDETYSELEDGTYKYGVSTMIEGSPKTILNEGFEGGTSNPSGWTSTGYWYPSTSPVHTGSYSVYCYNNNSGYMYTMTSPVIDLGDCVSSTLSFYYQNKWYNSSYGCNTLKVKVKAIDEVSWNTLNTYSSNVVVFTLSQIDLADYLGKQVQITFEVTTKQYSSTYIDDIVVTGVSMTDSRIVWSNEIKKGGIVFTNAADDKDWNNAANWSTGEVPANDGTAEVTIKASAVISSDVNVKYLAISGGALTINSGATLTVAGEMVNNDPYNFIIKDGAQVVQNNEGVPATFHMNITNPATWGESTDGWQFISSPFTDSYISGFTGQGQYTKSYDLFKYNGMAELEWDKQNNDPSFELVFQQGRGYLASYETETTAYLEGTLNSENSFEFEVPYNAEKDLANFHLLGNPFPFDMDMSKATYTNLVEGYAVVNPSDGGYKYFAVGSSQNTADGTIKVGDGFFVKATGEDPSFSYNVESRAKRGESFNSLNLIATGNAGEDNLVINLAGKQEGFPKLKNFNDDIATLFVENSDVKYGIFYCNENTTEVEVSFHANEMGNYTIAAVPSGKFQTLTLVDRFTGIETNLLVEDYHFTATSSDNANRFIVKLAVSDQQSAVSDNFVYQSGEELIVDAEGTVQIIDVMGRIVYSDDVESTNNRIDVSEFRNGTYMVRVINGSEVKVEKVVIY